MQVEKTTLSYTPEEVQARIAAAIRTLYLHISFCAVLLEKVRIVMTDKVPTAGVDYGYETIGINPKFLASIDHSYLSFVLCHEVMHIALDSFGRLHGRDLTKWNIATDYAINGLLYHAFNKSIPSEALHNLAYDSMSAEEIYATLPEGETCQTFIYLEGDSSGADLSDDLDNVVKMETPDIQDSEDKAEPGDNESKPKEVNWNAQIAKALTHAKIQGTMSSSLETKIRGLSESGIEWEILLRQKLNQNLSTDNRDDYTYRPPNRRVLHNDEIRASMIGHKPPSIAFVVDTSGSMSPSEWEQGAAEMSAIRDLYSARMYFIACDYAVTKAHWVEPYEPMPTLVGGGGTAFPPIFEHLKKNLIDVDVVVIFTDGYGEFPEDPGYDTIWVITSTVVPPFGDCVNVRIPDKCR